MTRGLSERAFNALIRLQAEMPTRTSRHFSARSTPTLNPGRETDEEVLSDCDQHHFIAVSGRPRNLDRAEECASPGALGINLASAPHTAPALELTLGQDALLNPGENCRSVKAIRSISFSC